jgi:hypothetical protein
MSVGDRCSCVPTGRREQGQEGVVLLEGRVCRRLPWGSGRLGNRPHGEILQKIPSTRTGPPTHYPKHKPPQECVDRGGRRLRGGDDVMMWRCGCAAYAMWMRSGLGRWQPLKAQQTLFYHTVYTTAGNILLSARMCARRSALGGGYPAAEGCASRAQHASRFSTPPSRHHVHASCTWHQGRKVHQRGACILYYTYLFVFCIAFVFFGAGHP